MHLHINHKINSKALFYFRRFCLILGWLSLDVVLGAMVCNVMVFHLMKISIVPWFQVGILGATVWLIYIADHLWDVKRIGKKPVSQRHFFYFKNYNFLRNLAFLLFWFITVLSLFLLPLKIIFFGIFLGSFVCIYLLAVHFVDKSKVQNWFHKEIFVSLLYGIGIWGSAGIFAAQIELYQLLLASIFIILAFQNLLIFSLYELEEDIQQKQQSIVQSLGKNTVKRINVLLSIFILVLGIITLIFYKNPLVQNWIYIEWTMAAILFCLASFPHVFMKNLAYRWTGDGVFILPAFLWIIYLFEM